MASNQPSNNSVYQSAGGFKNFTESYGGKLWDSGDAKAIGAKMQQYDARSGGSAKSTGGAGKSNSSRK